MTWKIEFSETARRTLLKLDRQDSKRIVEYLSARVATSDNPRSLGSALRGPRYANKWRYRIGDFRVIAEIHDGIVTIIVIEIGHRREIYR